MASSSLLAVGQTASLKDLKGSWLKFNISRNRKVQVAGNHKHPQARYFSVCYHAPKTGWDSKDDTVCNAHLKAVGPTRDEMTVISCDLNHTCTGGERKRNYMLKDIETVSNVFDNYTPTASKEGNPKQLMEIAKASIGHQMKNGQASKAVRAKSGDTLEAQIGQYLWIPSLFEAYMTMDPNGTYSNEYKTCTWDVTLKQFLRCYCAMSIAKHFWKHCNISMMVADGTHTRASAFKHIVLLAVTFDGNNQIIILAFAVVDVEDAGNWLWFKEKLDDDFPGWDTWMSDADKGIRSRAFTLSLSQTDDTQIVSRCTRHLSVNCAEACSGTMNEDHRNRIISLAKSRTKEVYDQRLQAIAGVNDQWARYLDARKEEFVCFTFLDRGVRRFGKVTSNAVENINGALKDIRAFPIVYMIEGIVDYQRKHYRERQEQASKWIDEGKQLTPYCAAHSDEVSELATKREVRIFYMNYPIYKARVSTGVFSNFTGYIEVVVDVRQHTSECPCRHYDEVGTVCLHVKALLLKLGGVGRGIEWCDKIYHMSSYKKSYGAPIPGMALAGKLSVDETHLPPDHRNMAGRPQKKRRDRSYLRKTDVRRTCKACGEQGHFSVKCKKPSTEYRWNEHGEKAIAYCKSCQMDVMDI